MLGTHLPLPLPLPMTLRWPLGHALVLGTHLLLLLPLPLPLPMTLRWPLGHAGLCLGRVETAPFGTLGLRGVRGVLELRGERGVLGLRGERGVLGLLGGPVVQTGV